MITLADIAGYKEEKQELKKIIDLVSNFKNYENTGIYIPKGLILQGPPGCGKTLMAQALANECKVPFFSFTNAGNGEANLKNLKEIFAKAKEKTPSIVYIDELDKLTSCRYFDSDAVRAMVQFLLTELDGANNTQGILLIASTNDYNDLPESLIRSGRMDKKICIDIPDTDSIIEILKYYIKDNPIFETVNIKSLALKIKGMTGADIKTLINNVLIEYVGKKDKLVVDDFVDLINQMNFEDIGRRWSNKAIVTKVLIHEAGHSVVNYCLTGKYGSISGVQYGDSAGHTYFDDDFDEIEEDLNYLDLEEDQNITKKDMLNSIAAAFAGMMAEQEFYGTFDTGGMADIVSATHIVHRMSSFYFLDSKFINIDVDRLNDQKTVHQYLKVRDRIFRKQKRICKRCIKNNKYLIRYIVDEAMKNEDTLNSTQIHNCIDYYKEHRAELIEKYKNTPIPGTKTTK